MDTPPPLCSSASLRQPPQTKLLRTLEFFSGIGGLHYSAELALGGLTHADGNPKFDLNVLAAFDINTVANSCYKFNFNMAPLATGIERLSADKINKFKANCWFLSPPCQPYTQGGKSLDDQDNRADGLLNLLEQLPKLEYIPEYFFLENVPNFEISKSREKLINTLDDLGFSIKEYLVSPLQFGVANDRRRYYLAAVRKPLKERETSKRYIEDAIILSNCPNEFYDGSSVPKLSAYFEDLSDFSKYIVPDHYILKRKNFRFDLVTAEQYRSSTFTKAYGSHHVIGSGSFIQTKNLDQPLNFQDTLSITQLGLRFFTPIEVARLNCFPVDEIINLNGEIVRQCSNKRHEFKFPENVGQKQRWRLLGNSLNVRVIAVIMRSVLFS